MIATRNHSACVSQLSIIFHFEHASPCFSFPFHFCSFSTLPWSTRFFWQLWNEPIELLWLTGFLHCVSQFLNQSMSSEHSDNDSLPMTSPVDSKPLIDHTLRPQKENDLWVPLSIIYVIVQSGRTSSKGGFLNSRLSFFLRRVQNSKHSTFHHGVISMYAHTFQVGPGPAGSQVWTPQITGE